MLYAALQDVMYLFAFCPPPKIMGVAAADELGSLIDSN